MSEDKVSKKHDKINPKKGKFNFNQFLQALKDGDGIPQLCAVCERSSFLRCVECNVSYCSGACQIKVCIQFE